jgi:two-component system, OmpR family, sensor kinase
MPLMRSFRAQLTALYLAFFSLLFVLFSIFLYGELSRSLTNRLEVSLASEADTAAVLFPDELQEMKGDEIAAAREVVSELKVHGDFVTIREGSRILAASPQSPPDPRDPSATRVVHAGGRTYHIVVSASLDTIHAELAVVRRAIFVALPLILALAGLGGYWLATRSLRPLGWMAEQARNITGSNLETRIKIGNAAEELAVLVTSFNELLSRLDQSFETMRRFVADASHELRTPIAVIRGEADVALSQERTPAEYRESLGIILDEARRLSRLVDDLLNLARADAGHVQLQTHDFYLNELLGDCCRSVQGLANSRGLKLECLPGSDLQFSGDEQLLRRLVINLLDNALRYTPSGGKVTAALDAGSASVRLRISDTGIGIAPDDAARVFERFYRAGEARSRQNGGVGLGLAIVRWIAESHRGTVECASHPGQGSTFIVTLPK